ncbi:LysR family transcriptional regulator [Rhizobium lemnae]|uniref:LysR family transcriptional regulator n=1 Tax=Rhizobium lemnae TaxID=1214924 RepID=A0ABV8EAY6_9HYPH|nr:LysR family transcriptional regulator [Rhizobium lemnae]MCJ8509242.1 LysR family transcriptional regulator [Rhizobium lemnae]
MMSRNSDLKSRPARTPPLGALKAFTVAARHESFALAAEELHVTHGAISKQIGNLEEILGEALFVRRNRRVFLTDRGRELAMKLSAVFQDLDNAVADFRGNQEPQPLIVSCEPTLCLKFLIPNLADLKSSTGLEVKVLAAGGRIDFRRDHIDLAVRRNDFPIDPQLHVKELAPEFMGMVCAPSVAKILEQHADSVPALHTRSRPEAWQNWRLSQPKSPRFASNVIYEHFYMAIEGAMAGQGVGLASIHMVASDLASGRLQALGPFKPDGTQYLALSASPYKTDTRHLIFIDWLARRMQAHIEKLQDVCHSTE